MLGKYINQFMADNELSVNEEFFIENMDGNKELKKQGVEMIDYEKLLDALKTIQDECAKHKVCTDCPFFVQSDDSNCGILSRNPVNWKLNKVHVIRLINQ